MKRAVVLGFALAASAACRSPSPPPSAAGTQPPPPSFTFQAPEPWRSKKPGEPPVAPPDLTVESWRVFASQTEPLQRKTPRWQTLEAQRTVELEMPEGSEYRCLVTPLRVEPKANTWGTKLMAWAMERTLMCSSDDYRTWIESTLRVKLRVDGTREVGEDAGAVLRSRAGDGVRKMFVLMRADKERREATFGPPQIVAGEALDDDDG